MMQRILSLLGSLRITVAGLFLLLILTVWGTLYQVDFGLYQAQERFYQSWFLMIGGVVPFPGAQLVMLVLFINLLASILLLAVRGRLRWGLIITHSGLLLMLAAGAVTFYLGREAHLSLVEGEGSNVAQSYNEWELVLLPSGGQGGRKLSTLPLRALRPGREIPLPGGHLSLRIEEVYRHSQPVREAGETSPVNASGFTGLQARPVNKEPAADQPGVLFILLEDGQERDRYLLWAGDSAPTELRGDAEHRALGLRRQRLLLPAVIQLLDFRRELHPGSGIAKSYSSQVLVQSNEDSDRKVLISMNKPLRLKGFTFYQSSFSSAPGGREISTLSVVQNYGRTMPYLATGITVLGMLLHFTGMLVTRLRPRSEGRAV